MHKVKSSIKSLTSNCRPHVNIIFTRFHDSCKLFSVLLRDQLGDQFLSSLFVHLFNFGIWFVLVNFFSRQSILLRQNVNDRRDLLGDSLVQFIGNVGRVDLCFLSGGEQKVSSRFTDYCDVKCVQNSEFSPSLQCEAGFCPHMSLHRPSRTGNSDHCPFLNLDTRSYLDKKSETGKRQSKFSKKENTCKLVSFVSNLFPWKPLMNFGTEWTSHTALSLSQTKAPFAWA